MRPMLLLFVSQFAYAQLPRVANAKLETRPAGSLGQTVQAIISAQETPVWVAYTVPAMNGNNNSCCWADNNRGCVLEGQYRSQGMAAQGPVMLEGPSTLVVLLRVEHNALDRIRTVSGDCELDAGGLPVFYLTGARPAESVALLEKTVTDRSDHGILAIAMHADPAAEAALERLVGTAQPEKIREKTLFWLGSTQRQSSYETLKRVALKDPSEHIRDKAMFALSVSRNPDAVDTLVQAAKNDGSARVRGQALFWLGQKAGAKESAAIVGAVANDPDVEVKKKALFALTQMPKEEGIPKLIEIARTNRTPEVRKQAMFWLGQSKDPRALTFFQEVLK